MKSRKEKMQAAIKSAGMDAVWITIPENMRYLTGYTGEGSLFMDLERTVVLTDFRYVEQVSIQAPDVECIMTTSKRKPEAILAEIASGKKKIAVEMDDLSVSNFRKVQEALPEVDFIDLGGIVDTMRQIKDVSEEENIVCASEIACRAFDDLLGIMKPGMTEKEVALELDYCMLRRGSEKVAFETIAAAGKHGSLPHAVPTDHKLEKGELVTLDFGAQVNGYKTDMTRTVALGQIDDSLRRIYDTVLDAQLFALSIIEPGKLGSEIDGIIHERIEKLYPGCFGHSLGHGVGLMIHEGPNLSSSPRGDVPLEAGHVVTVEPGIYVPGVGGCRIEDTIIMRPDGFMNLITAPKELIIL